MELVIGIGGILAITVFAAVFGVDIRTIIGDIVADRRNSQESDDPNSTMAVTQQVIRELGKPESAS